MLFNSLAFAIFLPIVLTGYYALNRRGQNVWLLVASLVFYGWWDKRFLLLLIVPTVIDYLCAARIHASSSPKSKKRYLVFSICTNLAILCFFKYFNFFIDSASLAFKTVGIEYAQPALHIILPVGISFYTFHELSYVIDIYRGETQPVRSFLTYVLYVLYFPQLVAGPIARASILLPQLEQPRQVNWQNIREGLLLMLIGFFKKVGVADALAPAVDIRFQNPGACSGADLLGALYLFAVQIYCDFSGYTDIARGVSKLMGIELSLNFNHPYFAWNITEFWRRWHISLSTWLRDYLYIPLGGNRKGTAKTYRNLMLTMLLGGLWHGASWTFVVWGGLHGLYLSLHKYWLDLKGNSIKSTASSAMNAIVFPLKVIFTFHLVALTWIFFRAKSFDVAWSYLSGIVLWRQAGAADSMNYIGIRIVLLLAALFGLELLQEGNREQTGLLQLNWMARGICYATLILLILVFGGWSAQIPFIYFQF